MLPLLALLIVLFSGYSPNMAAFMGLMFCIVVGFTSFHKPLTLIVHADRTVTYDTLVHVTQLAREAGIQDALLATMPRLFPQGANPPDKTP